MHCMSCSPRLCVGFLFLVLHPVRLLPLRLLLPLPSPPHTQLIHTQLAHTHTTCNTQLTHTQLAHTHTTYSHTQLSHTQLAHTHNLHTHNLYTHTQLAHTRLAHTHTTYSHTTCAHTHTQLAHTQLTHTHTQLTHTQLAHTLCVAGVALCDIHLHFVWQAWQLCDIDLHFAVAVCVAGVALHDMDCYFAWQAWHLMTSTFVSRGRRGTWTHNLWTVSSHNLFLATWIVTLRGRHGTHGTGLALVARSVPTCRRGRRGFLRGRCGTWRHVAALCVASVAGVALWDIHLHFVWQAWHFVTWIVTLRGRRGTLRHPPSFHVAGVARMALGWLWWRARFPHVAVDAAAFCVAGVALGDM